MVTQDQKPIESSDPSNPSTSDQPQPLLLMNTPAESQPLASPNTNTLAVGGEAVSLDHLGPMVINTDGTISRISNWDNLSELEQKRTLRLVAQRNARRIARIKQDEALHQSNPISTSSTHPEL